MAVAGLGLISCSKETGLSADGTRVAYIGLAADAGSSGTKSSIDSLSVSWTAGDDILYYTGRYTSGSSTAKTGEGSYKVPAACSDLKLPVEYNDGDNRVTILTKGRAVGNVTPASLNSLTIAGAVPASQDGTFASYYIAACEGNLLELPELTTTVLHNLAMTPVQAYIRFKLSSLTVNGQTVNKITVAGKVGGSAVPVCGDLTVTVSENGSTTHTVSSATGSNPGNLITIDKTGSKFNAGEYIYVALLPGQYDELSLTLYNSGTILATVPVKQSSGQIDASCGRMVDIGEINAHAKIKFVSAKMYPERVAISSERPIKYLWLKIEPEDFSGTVTWTSSNTSYATVESAGELVDEPGIGKCIRVKVTNKKIITSGSQFNFYPEEFEVDITATITDQSDGQTYTSTCQITIGDFLDLGIRNSEGKRILFMRHILRSNRQETPPITYQPYWCEERNTPNDLYEGSGLVEYAQMRVLYGWGEIHSMQNNHMEPLRFAWNLSNGTYVGERSSTNGEYQKYNLSLHLPHLQRYEGEFVSEGIAAGSKFDTVDDVASRWNQDCNIPTVSDMVAFISGTKKDPTKHTYTAYGYGTSYYKVEGTSPGYTDTYLYITDRAQAVNVHPWEGNFGWWTCEDEVEYVGNAFYFDGITYSIKSTNKYRRSYVRPVKYVD